MDAIGNEIEQLIRRLVREELQRVLAGDAEAEPDDMKQRAIERAAAMRRGAGKG